LRVKLPNMAKNNKYIEYSAERKSKYYYLKPDNFIY
jgi:hypothetical protein